MWAHIIYDRKIDLNTYEYGEWNELWKSLVNWMTLALAPLDNNNNACEQKNAC